MLKHKNYVQCYEKKASVNLPFAQYKKIILEMYSSHPFVTIKVHHESELELTFYVDYQDGQLLTANAKIGDDSHFLGYEATSISLVFRRELILRGHMEILFLARACTVYWIMSLILVGSVIEGGFLLRFACVGLPLLACLFVLVFGDVSQNDYSEGDFEKSKLHERLRAIFASLLSVTTDGRSATRYNVWD